MAQQIKMFGSLSSIPRTYVKVVGETQLLKVCVRMRAEISVVCRTCGGQNNLQELVELGS